MAKNHTTEARIHENDLNNGTATYCAEDDKIRLYVGRVERETYNFLRANKFVATPKQSCDFVAVWSPKAEDIAFQLIAEDDDIQDEDYSPEERAADRAERFAGYRDKRRAEAGGHADTYSDGPQAFGAQNAARAERQAARHERHRDRALCQWSKATYWQSRTAGVIANALHRSDAATRRGRILTIEAEIRQIEAYYTPCPKTPHIMDTDYREADKEARFEKAWCGQGRGGHWVRVDRLDAIRASYARTVEHLKSRLIYENAMLENEGGQASEVEMIPGGFITYKNRWGNTARGEYQILKVNRSPVTKRVTSVEIVAPRSIHRKGQFIEEVGTVLVNIERKGEDIYRAPTPEELEAFNARQKAKKAAKPVVPTMNPTDEDAQALQDLWNAEANAQHGEEAGIVKVGRMTQAEFSAGLKHDYVFIHEKTLGGQLVKLRMKRGGGFYNYSAAYQIIVLTDKPQKPLPTGWNTTAPAPQPEPVAEIQVETVIEETTEEREPAPVGCLF